MRTNFDMARLRRTELLNLIAAAADEIAAIDRGLPILYSQALEADDAEILKAIYEKSHSSLIAPLFLMEKFGISDEEIGDRLEIMDDEGYVKVAKGTYTPSLSLLNGINYVGIAAKGRQTLRDKKLI